MSFTVHDIDPELDQKLTDRARRENLSKNQLVKRILGRAMGVSTGGPEDDYREFLGAWSAQEKAAFDRQQKDNERIDDREWE
ncbi:MAG TPA: hypothetical protein VKA06_01115 [Spirochaetia bacterium]|nr:hypothetical protein [Spirochaetia bacterium]